ncbi:MAG: TonB-dependent receptor [Bacteroidales bacterium]|nr:TonB-dependent receptor [Bacteroidales bacterium]
MLKKSTLIILFALLPWLAQAQFTLSGKVVDAQTKQSLPGATVFINHSLLATVTDAQGTFFFKHVKPGSYELEVRFMGFQTKKQTVKVSGNTELTIPLKSTSFMSDEVVISATTAQKASPNTYQDISGMKLNQNNQGKDLPFLLQMTPSVVVTSDAGAGVGYTGLRIRGVGLNGINVTLNGVPVNDAESQDVYFVDLPNVASLVSTLQIQRGVGTSSNGSAAFGASINMQTDAFQPDAYVEIDNSAGSFQTFKNNVRFSSGLLHKHWILTGNFSNINSQGYIDRAFSHLKSAYLSAGYFGKKDIFKAIVMLGHEKTYQAWYGVPKDSLATNRTYNPAGEIYDANGKLLGYYPNETDNYTQDYYQLHYAHQFTKQFNLATAVFLTRGYGYYESYDNNQSFADYGLNDTVIGNTTVSTTNLIEQKWLNNYFYGFNVFGNYAGGRSKWSFGGGWNYYDGDHYGKVIWAQVALLGEYDRNWYFNTGLKADYNLFVKWNYKLNDQLNLMADVQYRGIHYQIKGIHDNLRNISQSHQFQFLNPKAGIYYTVNQDNSLYFSFAVSHREPNRSVYRDADPNQVIKQEKLMDYELGYQFHRSDFSIHTTLYYMDYKDQFVLTGKINNVGTAILTNVPKSYRAGIELSAHWKASKFADWNLMATFSQNKILGFTEYVDNWNYWDDPATQPYQYSKYLGTTDISFSPDVIAGSVLTLHPVTNGSISWTSKYVGRQYIDNTSTKERSLNPYWVNNLRLDYTVHNTLFRSMTFVLSLNNIFNALYSTNAWVYNYYYNQVEYEMNGYFPQAGFNFMAGINLKL